MPRLKSPVKQRPLSVRIREDILQIIEEDAARERRSMNAQIETILERAVEEKLRDAQRKEPVAV